MKTCPAEGLPTILWNISGNSGRFQYAANKSEANAKNSNETSPEKHRNNNTAQSMNEITKNPKWFSAQVPFVDLSEKFRSNPVKLPA
jgi:hypothetical protein